MRNVMTIMLILLATLLVQVSVGVNAVMIPVHLSNMGFNKIEIGFCLSLEIFAVLCISSYINKILSKFGLFKSLLVATLLRALVMWRLAELQQYWAWLMCMFLYGMCTNIFLIALQTWLGTLSLKRFSGLVIGVYSAVLAIGVALGPLALDIVGGIEGVMPFYMNAVIILVTFVPFILGFWLIPKIHSTGTARVFYILKNAPIVMFSAFVGGITFFGLPAFSTLVGIQDGLPADKAAYLITAFMLGAICIGLILSSVSDFIGPRRLTVVCVFIGLACAVYFPLAISHYEIVLGLLFVWGGVMNGVYAMGLGATSKFFRQEDLVSANVTYGLMDCLGGVVGVFLIGVAMQLWHSEGMTYVIVAAGVIYFTFVLSQKRVLSFET